MSLIIQNGAWQRYLTELLIPNQLTKLPLFRDKSLLTISEYRVRGSYKITYPRTPCSKSLHNKEI